MTDNQHRKTKRRRIIKACRFCKERKIRCDGKSPCSECSLRFQSCIYSDLITKRGPKRGEKWKKQQQQNAGIPLINPSSLSSTILSSSMISYLIKVFLTNIHPIWPMFVGFPIKQIYHLSFTNPILFDAILTITAKTQAIHQEGMISASLGRQIKDKMIIKQDQVVRLVHQLRSVLHSSSQKFQISLESVQTLILMALIEFGEGKHDFAFHCSSQASLMTIELGLYSMDDERRKKQGEIHHQDDLVILRQKTTFWCTFVLDKLLALMLEKPMILRKSEINCEPKFVFDHQHSPNGSSPLSSSTKTNPSTLLIYQEYIGLILILQDIIEDVYTHSARSKRYLENSNGLNESYIHSTKIHAKSLQDWKNGLPEWIQEEWKNSGNKEQDELQSNSNSNSEYNNGATVLQIFTLQAWYHACLLLLHRPLFGAGQEHHLVEQYHDHKMVIQTGHHIVCKSAMAITNCLKLYQNTNSVRCIPSSWVFLTFLSAVIHATCTHHHKNKDHSNLNSILNEDEMQNCTHHKSSFDDCISLLREISQTWNHAGKQVESLYLIFNNQTNNHYKNPIQQSIPTSNSSQNVAIHSQYDNHDDDVFLLAGQQSTSFSKNGEVDINSLWNDLLSCFDPAGNNSVYEGN